MRKKSRFISLFMSILLICNVVLCSFSGAFVLSGTAAATALVGTGATAGKIYAAGSTLAMAGFVIGGIGRKIDDYKAMWVNTTSLLSNVFYGLKMDISNAYTNIQAMNFVKDYKLKNALDMDSSYKDAVTLRQYEIDGVLYDIMDFGPAVREWIMSNYYGLDEGESVTVDVSPNMLLDTSSIDTGYGVASDGTISPLMSYDSSTGKVVLCDFEVDAILSTKVGSKNTPAKFKDFGNDGENTFYMPTGMKTTGSEVRPQASVDYYNSEMWRAYSNFERFVQQNPISTVLKVPNDLTSVNDTTIDIWNEVTEDNPIHYKLFNDESCPSLDFYTTEYTGTALYGHSFFDCADCNASAEYEFYFDGLGAGPVDLYAVCFPKYSYSSSTGAYTLQYVGIRIYYPYRYSGEKFYWQAVDDYVSTSKMCGNCKSFYESKFLKFNDTLGVNVAADGCESYSVTYTGSDLNKVDFYDETKDYVLAVPSGATYSDIENGTASLEWIDLNSTTYKDVGSIPTSQFEEVELLENTGSVNSTVDSPSIDPDYPDDPTYGNVIDGWITGDITVSPDILDNLLTGVYPEFESLGDSIAYGTATGMQASKLAEIISALTQALNPSISAPTTAPLNPNLLDLILIIWDVLISSIMLVARFLVFIAGLSLIEANPGFLPAGVIQGINFFKTLSWGSLNLWSLVVWFVSIMFGITVIKIIRNHYHV